MRARGICVDTVLAGPRARRPRSRHGQCIARGLCCGSTAEAELTATSFPEACPWRPPYHRCSRSRKSLRAAPIDAREARHAPLTRQEQGRLDMLSAASSEGGSSGRKRKRWREARAHAAAGGGGKRGWSRCRRRQRRGRTGHLKRRRRQRGRRAGGGKTVRGPFVRRTPHFNVHNSRSLRLQIPRGRISILPSNY